MCNEEKRFKIWMSIVMSTICLICVILIWTMPDEYFTCVDNSDYVYIIIDDSDSNCEYNYGDNDEDTSNPSYEFAVTGGQGRVSPTNPFSSSSYPSVWK